MSIFNKYIKPKHPELSALMDSNLDCVYKLHFLKASMNNMSRSFSSVVIPKQSSSKQEGVLMYKGYPYMVCMSTDMNNAVCRQYYQGLKGYFCYNPLKDKVYFVDNHEYQETSGVGTGNHKNKAVTVTTPTSECTELNLTEFEGYLYND